MMSPPRIPLATYRFQFNRDFTFDHATALVPYLHALGITHIYASPYLKARPGSTHGYDITDHNTLNPEIGTQESFARFCETLRAHGMGQILDFVPNHMGVGKADNAWWLDVLEWGEASPFADYFDIDWTAARRNFPGKVLLPVLGDYYGAVLERGEITLKFDAESGGFDLWYFENRFPIRPRDYATIIRRGLSEISPPPPPEVAGALERYAGEFAGIASLPRSRIRRGRARERGAQLKAELARLARENQAAQRLLEDAAGLYRGRVGEPESFLRLHNLIERQFYRIAYWRTAADEINYRRFFEINDLAGIRPENPRLFAEIHKLVVRLIENGCVHGLRLDHIDGLYDPEAYCKALEALASRATARTNERQTRKEASDREALFYIVVEKILARHERLREAWPVQGTSGYEFLNLLNGLLVDRDGEAALDDMYRRFSGCSLTFDEIVYESKKHIIDTALASELAVLANQLDRLAEQDWRTRDFTRFRLRDALKEIVASFPVYRTYVSERGVAPDDRRDIEWAITHAKKRWRAPDPEIFDFIHDALLGRLDTPLGLPRRADVLRFAMRFQQYTGPVTAKSLEDTAFYRYHRLISLNEVGGDPRQFGISVSSFHRANEERARHWPHAMLASATHDTKRGEDARARLNVLSEIPEAWGERMERWAVLNRSRRAEVEGELTPSRNDEYFLYQALIGIWPAEWTDRRPDPGPATEEFMRRFEGYIVKALREAKLRSSWARPNEAVEAACVAFAKDLVDTTRQNLFLDDFLPFQARIAFFGMLSSLAQTALKLTCPGVPDIYRGCELWDLSGVDPDNRRPVDFNQRQALLTVIRERQDWQSLLANWHDGAIKLAVIHRFLALRRAHPDLFTFGEYVALDVEGPQAQHVVAFARRVECEIAIVATGRLFARLWGDAEPRYEEGRRWGDTSIVAPRVGDGVLRDGFTGQQIECLSGRIPVANVFKDLPIAVLVLSAIGAGQSDERGQTRHRAPALG